MIIYKHDIQCKKRVIEYIDMLFSAENTLSSAKNVILVPKMYDIYSKYQMCKLRFALS